MRSRLSCVNHSFPRGVQIVANHEARPMAVEHPQRPARISDPLMIGQ